MLVAAGDETIGRMPTYTTSDRGNPSKPPCVPSQRCLDHRVDLAVHVPADLLDLPDKIGADLFPDPLETLSH
jgi:hypothetical protein